MISGGGTGGHIFPAIAIANEIKRRHPDAKLLFVGAEDRMEMERVPAAGYDIVGLPVCGFDRRQLWRNFMVMVKLLKSMSRARRILRDFKPDIAIGVGGYASGAVVDMFSVYAEGGGVISREWTPIWMIFAAYALVLALVFTVVFRYKHTPEKTL